jgi:hypothetical protein
MIKWDGEFINLAEYIIIIFSRLSAKLRQLLLHTSPAVYLPIVTLVKTSGGGPCLQMTSCIMMSFHTSNLQHLSMRPTNWVLTYLL